MRDNALARQEKEKANPLGHCYRDGEETAPTDEARAASLPLFRVRLLHLGKDDGRQLHDNRGGDIGAHAKHDDGEGRESTTGKYVEEIKELVVRKERGERRLVDTRDRNRGKNAEDGERADQEKNPGTNLVVTERETKFVSKLRKHSKYYYALMVEPASISATRAVSESMQLRMTSGLVSPPAPRIFTAGIRPRARRTSPRAKSEAGETTSPARYIRSKAARFNGAQKKPP